MGTSMSRIQRRAFSPEFRLEAAQLVVVKGCTVREAAEAMNVGLSSMDRWAAQLRRERNKETPTGSFQLSCVLLVRTNTLLAIRQGTVWLSTTSWYCLVYCSFFLCWAGMRCKSKRPIRCCTLPTRSWTPINCAHICLRCDGLCRSGNYWIGCISLLLRHCTGLMPDQRLNAWLKALTSA